MLKKSVYRQIDVFERKRKYIKFMEIAKVESIIYSFKYIY